MPSAPERLLYEYAVVRFVPDMLRGEFINIGLVMMCKRRRWIRIGIKIDEARLHAFKSVIKRDVLDHQLKSFVAIAEGDRCAGEIAMLPVEERFRWITAVKSAAIQTSRPHPGLCETLDETFDHLFSELVE